MPQIDLVDDTFVDVPPELVASRVREPALVAALWPDLTVRLAQDRGLEGRRYLVGGPLTGTAEVWLEPVAGGVTAHVYLRADPATGPWSARRVRREVDRRRRHVKRVLWSVKDELERNGR